MNFRQVLLAGYPAWERSATQALHMDRGFLDEAFDDWAQANWELLVERPLCAVGEFLTIYGSGSDYEQQLYSRVFFHNAAPTHAIVVKSTNPPAIDLLKNVAIDLAGCTFERLVARADSWFEDRPPFDHVVVVRAGKPALLPLTSVRFERERIDDLSVDATRAG